MSFAAGSYHGLSYVEETTFATTPTSPTYQALRHTSCSLALSKDGFQSNELRSDRQISDFRHGVIRTQGDAGIEFSYSEFDDMLEAALFGTWVGDVLKAGVVARSFTFRRRFADILLDGYFTGVMANSFSLSIPANAMVTGSFGFIGSGASYDGTPHNCTVTVTAGTGAGGAGTVVLTINGTAHTTASIAESESAIVVATAISTRLTTDGIAHTRTDAAIALTGIPAIDGAVPTVVFSLGTATGPTATVGAIAAVAPTASAILSPFDSFTGEIKEGGGTIAVITSIDFNLQNGLEPVFVVGRNTTPRIVPGRSNLTGTVSAYFENKTMLDKFINETESSIELELGATSEKYDFEIPRIKYTGSDNPVSGEGPIVLNMPFQALYDETEETNLIITRTP